LIFNDDKSLAEIAFEMKIIAAPLNLSTQFKKETGITPSEFKKIKDYNFQKSDNL